MNRELPSPPAAAALQAIPRSSLEALAARLRAAEYTPAILGLAERIGPGQLDASRLPLVQWHLEREGSAAATLALLFSYYAAVPRERVARILGAGELAVLERAGIVCPAPGRPAEVIASCELLPFETLWMLSDYPTAGPDAVMGPGGTTSEVAHLLPRALRGSLLDAGCGAGSLALVAAARGAAPVCGADINPRAIVMARLNAALNGIDAEFVTGSWTTPVRGRTFDRVVAQPPYVIQPPDVDEVTYLHGGPRGDRFVRQFLAELPSALAPGGRALVLMDAAVEAGVPMHQPLRAALGDPSLDVIALIAPGLTADMQARAYAAIDDPSLGARFARETRRYREHLASLGDPEFRHVALLVARTVRPRGGPPLTAMLPVKAFRGGARRDVDEVLDAMTLAHAGPAELGAATLRATRSARWSVELERPDAAGAGRNHARFEAGSLGMDQELSDASLALLSTLAEPGTLGAAAARYAALCEAAPGEVREQVEEFVRHGLATGLIEPVGGA